MAKPACSHLTAALHVVKYLKGKPSLGLLFLASTPLQFKAFSDADWGSCPDTRKSLTGFCIFLGTSLIPWRCKKQTIVSASSAEAEYRALGSTVRELQWLSYLMHDFGIPVALPLPLLCDNMAALHITKNPVFHEMTKHLEIDCHIVRNLFLSGFILLSFTPSHSQLVDLFMKAFPLTVFCGFLSKMILLDIHAAHLEGGCRNEVTHEVEMAVGDGAEVSTTRG